jgi:hypothetical protein
MRDFSLCTPKRALVETDFGWYQGDVAHTDINGNYYVKLDGEAEIKRYTRALVWLLDDLEMEQN